MGKEETGGKGRRMRCKREGVKGERGEKWNRGYAHLQDPLQSG